KIITMSTAPLASAGMTPAAAGITVQPTVSTRKNVPINSAIYFLILVFRIEKMPSAGLSEILYRNGVGRGSYFFARRIFDIRASSFRGALALAVTFGAWWPRDRGKSA